MRPNGWASSSVLGCCLREHPVYVCGVPLRIDTLLDRILPVSARAAGLRSDSVLGKSLGPAALGTVCVPTLIVSVRDDGFGTHAGAQYTASQITGAKFVSFEHGGHVWVGHDEEVMTEITNLVIRARK